MCNSRRFFLLAMLAAVLPIAMAAKSKPAVSIKDMQFKPATISIKVGETVTWTNNDDRDHTVASEDHTFTSENLKPGATYSFQFPTAGKFAYSCTYHPRMKGVVNVTDK